MNLDPIKAREEYYRWLRMDGDQIDWVEVYVDGLISSYNFKAFNFHLKIWTPVIFKLENIYDLYLYPVPFTDGGRRLKSFGCKEKDLEEAKIFARNWYRKWKYKQIVGEEMP